jgi:divalent metal cation (Fe/Co/Zn/Cd) transporter
MRTPTNGSAEDDRPLVLAALRISILSVAWTVVSSTLAVAIGLHQKAFVLVTFGAVGIVDCVGSVALTLHFAHVLRRQSISERLEETAHRIVLVGLLCVGGAAVLVGALRLASNATSSTSSVGVILAGSSLVALCLLAIRKISVARRLPSPALRSDGQLSGVGASLAAVTLVGTFLESSFHVDWADSTATIVLGVAASTLSIATLRGRHAD